MYEEMLDLKDASILKRLAEYYKDKDLDRAVSFYKMVADADDADGLFMVGKIAFDTDFAGVSGEEAEKCLSRAVAKKHKKSAFLLARMYLMGKGVEKDRNKSDELYTYALSLS